MATMYITEYSSPPLVESGAIQIPQEPPLAVQKIDFTAGSTATAELNGKTKLVSVQLDVDGHTHFNATPVATSSTSRIHKAYDVSFHGVTDALKVAALAI